VSAENNIFAFQNTHSVAHVAGHWALPSREAAPLEPPGYVTGCT